jgi:ankyrin repeat protein
MNTFSERAFYRDLTVEEVNNASKEELQQDEFSGYTIVWCASGWCTVEVVEAILNKGIDINLLSKDNCTGLMSAAEYGNWDIVKLLLTRGANAKLLNLVC